MSVFRSSVTRLREIVGQVGKRAGVGTIVDAVRALGAPDHEQGKAYRDYRELSSEEIAEKLEKVDDISDDALRVQAGRKTADYYIELRRLHENE